MWEPKRATEMITGDSFSINESVYLWYTQYYCRYSALVIVNFYFIRHLTFLYRGGGWNNWFSWYSHRRRINASTWMQIEESYRNTRIRFLVSAYTCKFIFSNTYLYICRPNHKTSFTLREKWALIKVVICRKVFVILNFLVNNKEASYS